MALDPATNRLFVNTADKDSVAVIDGDSLRMVTEWKIDMAKGNSPIAFDSAHHRLFVVCGDPGMLAVLDSDTGRMTNTISVPADADDMDFDISQHRLFIPGGDGFLGVYDVSDPDHVKQRNTSLPGRALELDCWFPGSTDMFSRRLLPARIRRKSWYSTPIDPTPLGHCPGLR